MVAEERREGQKRRGGAEAKAERERERMIRMSSCVGDGESSSVEALQLPSSTPRPVIPEWHVKLVFLDEK